MKNIYFCSRTSHEVRGLKFLRLDLFFRDCSRTSHEVRGLKYRRCFLHNKRYVSHLTRGAWIEIFDLQFTRYIIKSHLTRGAWIEIIVLPAPVLHPWSHLTRGAWIEISRSLPNRHFACVAPHTRCVD